MPIKNRTRRGKSRRDLLLSATSSLWGRVGVGLLFCLILCGCITEYKPKGLDGIADILVVEGIITDDESYITLSRSVTITEENSWMFTQYVTNANVFVECDNDTQMTGYPDYSAGFYGGRYVIHTGKLNTDHQYRLKIEIDGIEYRSDYSHPIQTPEIDSIFWKKRGKGQPVMLYVATHDPDGKIQYYRWSYQENWEYHPEIFAPDYPYSCWSMADNKDLMLGSTEKTVVGKLMDMMIEISPNDKKLSQLYRIDIKQNVISKKAYDYFSNIKKNTQQTGSIFAPIPSELRGNISCVSDREKPVIGYVDVSSTTHNRRYIPRSANLYERPHSTCELIPTDSLMKWYYGRIPDYFIKIDPDNYAEIRCVDCTYDGGSVQKPVDWPNSY